MSSGLKRRLLLLLLIPLSVLACVNAWFDYRLADSAALQQDRQLLQLVPLLADSVVARGKTPDAPPVLLTAPAVEEFLKGRAGFSAFGIADLDGRVLVGDAWLSNVPPATREPEFFSEEEGGVTYRIVSQRVQTAGGELVVRLADGSDPRQQWVRLVLLKVLLPNLVLMLVVVFVVNWAVKRALRPLLALKDAVEHRSPRDLSAIDVQASPEEVRPLVESLNRLFDLVNAQAESQRRFVADAAHQLRTPLAGLQAQVEAWAQAVNTPAAAAAWREKYAGNTPLAPADNASLAINIGASQINRLRDAVRRTSQLANQLLALSRADARNLDAQPLHRVDLKELCETLLEVHLDAATAKRIDLGLDAQAVHVTGHEWLLRELACNLLDNALKYTPEGGTVTLRCAWTVDDKAPYLEVEDDGPGVPVAERRRVLERFYRVPGISAEGNGLGLAIADEIARVHRSQLVVGSGLGGRGTRITLLFGA
ncbi:sensor histidine kinase [Rhodoferax sp.]|uniref:sensor histidine kinase n=1 Tax=Rhodoferax sp. TaxID=50421 RepID=UPI00271C7625|nr:sensor histidine kinase [Rhodoferax sp.]MDO9198475.1 sensor histidine kinase N-terminal domain-containing protein [Rhodoferax sp.]